MGFSAASNLLWQEREALELLLFKLVTEQLIVSAGQTRWLARANDEVEQVAEKLCSIEVLRATEVDVLTDQMGRDDLHTLAELAAAAPEPWASIFTEHRDALLKLVVQIEQASDENRALLIAGSRAVRDTLLSLTDTVDTYDANGARGRNSFGGTGPAIVDEQA
jgi:2-succinyl-5-enolpyruvyl-6-hydroxy-3-cyclohexene-1-carboxylate synthase